MAYMAKLDENNVVIEVLAVADKDCPNPAPANEAQGAAFLQGLGLGTNWKQTSYNGNFRKQYAGIGYTYDAASDVFVAPQPFPSWSLDANYDWQPPMPMPTDGQLYIWDEETIGWKVIAE